MCTNPESLCLVWKKKVSADIISYSLSFFYIKFIHKGNINIPSGQMDKKQKQIYHTKSTTVKHTYWNMSKFANCQINKYHLIFIILLSSQIYIYTHIYMVIFIYGMCIHI